VTASARLPLLCGRRGAVLLRSWCSPGAVPRRAMPLSNAASRRAGVPGHRPGRLAARRLRGAGQIDRTSLLRFRSHPFDVHWPCRAVRKVPPPGPSRFGVRVATRRHPSRRSRRPCGFRASRLRLLSEELSHFPRARRGSIAVVARRGGDVARAGHSWLVFFGQRTYRARARAVLTAWPVAPFSCRRRHPWDLLITLRSVAPASFAGERAFFASRSGPPAVSPRVPPRVPSIAGSGCCAGSKGRRPRLLGFGPAGQPSPRCRRSRYSFCA